MVTRLYFRLDETWGAGHTEWVGDDTARVEVRDEAIQALFRLVEESEKAEADANLAALCPIEDVQVGRTIDARVGPPRLALGILAEDWARFLLAPQARTREPVSYFIKEDRTYSGMDAPGEKLRQYRTMLMIVSLLEQAALFLDQQRQVLIYFKTQKIEVPVLYTEDDLPLADSDSVGVLDKALHGDVHAEQRLAILDSAITDLVLSQVAESRFTYLVRNVGELAQRVNDGYRLFASNFSYDKIRGEVEAAQSEFISRIHKTFVDIQGQLLGLPVATVVVATQLKPVEGWGAAAWGNIAVLAGAWLFALLLFGSCVNQWFTLSAISADVSRQNTKLTTSFAEISGQFADVFGSLSTRICWHRFALGVIAAFAVGGAIFATVAFHQLTDLEPKPASSVERGQYGPATGSGAVVEGDQIREPNEGGDTIEFRDDAKPEWNPASEPASPNSN